MLPKDKNPFFTHNKAEFQAEKVFFRYLSKFYFFCRLKKFNVESLKYKVFTESILLP